MHSQQSQSRAAAVAARRHLATDFASRDWLRRRCPDLDRARRALLLGAGWLGALAMLTPDAVQAQQGPFIYVPNLSGNDVSVIDTPTNTVAPTAIPVGSGGFGRSRAG